MIRSFLAATALRATAKLFRITIIQAATTDITTDTSIMPTPKPGAAGRWARGSDPAWNSPGAIVGPLWLKRRRRSVGAIVVWRRLDGKVVGKENGQWIIQSGNDGYAVRTPAVPSVANAIAFRRAYSLVRGAPKVC